MPWEWRRQRWEPAAMPRPTRGGGALAGGAGGRPGRRAAGAAGREAAAVAGGLALLGGVGRRLERKGEAGGVVVYDDYGHHPTAIRETLAANPHAAAGRRG